MTSAETVRWSLLLSGINVYPDVLAGRPTVNAVGRALTIGLRKGTGTAPVLQMHFSRHEQPRRCHRFG